jgi:threonine synthase
VLQRARRGLVPAGAAIVITVTGHGLKDPGWALSEPDGTAVELEQVAPDVASMARTLGLE